MPKSPPRIIDEESMFEKACGSKGIRISKLNPKGGDLDKMVGEGEVQVSLFSFDMSGLLIEYSEEKKGDGAGDQVIANPAFEMVCKNNGIRFSIPGAKMHDVPKYKGMRDMLSVF